MGVNGFLAYDPRIPLSGSIPGRLKIKIFHVGERKNIMARKRVVSRTITAVTVTVMTVDTESAEVFNRELVIKHKCNRAEALREAKKQFESETVKVISVVDMAENVYRAQMDEDEFLKLASIVPLED